MRRISFITIAAAALNAVAAFGQAHPFAIRLPKALNTVTDTVEVCIIGDVMMHSGQLAHPHEMFLKHVSEPLKKADIAVANMEFSLGGEPYSGYPAFSAPDSYAPYIAGCGVNLFLTANNHILDRGASGAERTLGIYRAMKDSVLFTGSASNKVEMTENKPLVIVKKGIRIAFVNFTYGTNAPKTKEWPAIYGTDMESIGQEMKKARKNADFVIVLPHWGNEYETRHSKRQAELAAELVKMGADAIVGSHPHVIQDSTVINGKPVFYSIGNAVSNMSARNTRLELMVTLKFTHDHSDGTRKILGSGYRFMWCTLPGTLTGSYATIFTDEWKGRREEWMSPNDYDNMISTLERVREETAL